MQVANIKLKCNQSQHYSDSEGNAFLHTHLECAYVCNNICLSPHCKHNRMRCLLKCTGKGIKHW